MKIGRVSVVALAIALCSAAYAQDPQGAQSVPGPDGVQRGQGSGRGWGRGMGMGMGSGVLGSVTEAASDHFTVKNFAGETWTVHYSVNTRIMKQPARPAGEQGQERGFQQPESIKASEIKVGDAIMAGGEMDRDAKSVGAVMVMLLDPERARQMQEMQANYGKTWLMGRVTAINETKVTLEGGIDQTSHTFVADENTSFRRHREPITLGDVQVGDNVRVEGAIKDGQFVATTVSVMMPAASGGPVRRQGAPPQ